MEQETNQTRKYRLCYNKGNDAYVIFIPRRDTILINKETFIAEVTF